MRGSAVPSIELAYVEELAPADPRRMSGVAVFLLVGFVLCTAMFASTRVRSTATAAPMTFAPTAAGAVTPGR